MRRPFLWDAGYPAPLAAYPSADSGRAGLRTSLWVPRPERACHTMRRCVRSAWPCSGWGLPSQPGRPGCWCALTAPFHPYRGSIHDGGSRHRGGLLSVALSRTLRPVGVTDHPVLWSPDFPLLICISSGRPARFEIYLTTITPWSPEGQTFYNQRWFAINSSQPGANLLPEER
jgi:hypothetical protein